MVNSNAPVLISLDAPDVWVPDAWRAIVRVPVRRGIVADCDAFAPTRDAAIARACEHYTITGPWDDPWLTPTERKTWTQG